MDEISSNIQSIKLECLELNYASKVMKKVMKVLMKHLGIKVLEAFINGMGGIVNQVAVLLCVVVRISQGRDITLEYWLQLQLLVNLFRGLRIAIIDAFSRILLLSVNEKRLFVFLSSDSVSALPTPYQSDLVLQMEGASCAWGENPILKDLNLKIMKNEKFAIIGNSKSKIHFWLMK